MAAPLGPRIAYEELGIGNGLRIKVNDNAEEESLRIEITISSYYSKSYTGLRAYVEFFEESNRIKDVNNIIQDKRFWNLIEYYQKKIIQPLAKEEFSFTRNRNPQKPEINVKQRTNFLADIVRGIFSRSAFEANRTLTADFLVAYEYIRQRLNVYTSCKTDNDDDEMIVARTSIGRSIDVGTYKNLTLLNAKLPNVFLYLHLANVILANRLMLKQTRDLISGIEGALNCLRKRALPYSLMIAVLQGLLAYFVFYGGTEISLYNLFFKEQQQQHYHQQAWAVVNLFILPLLWPITAFFLRRYAPKIVSVIVRYTITRIVRRRSQLILSRQKKQQ